ncbi:MAG: HPr family phosphocarrier protein [Victivallales bacterium]|nr:HPr family phosphocarrier protein [Victivallales bacterium]
MSEPLTTEVTVQDQRGLHMRVATEITRASRAFTAQIRIHAGSRVADAKSPLSMLSLSAPCGTKLRITADGDDAAEALRSLEALLSTP